MGTHPSQLHFELLFEFSTQSELDILHSCWKEAWPQPLVLPWYAGASFSHARGLRFCFFMEGAPKTPAATRGAFLGFGRNTDGAALLVAAASLTLRPMLFPAPQASK